MTATASATVRIEHPRERVALLRIVRPPLQVLDIPTILALDEAFTTVEASDATVVVFAGGERAFSAGVDIADHTPDKMRPMLQAFHAVFRRMFRSRLATIAAVRGACLGGGMELALNCDIVVADESATFGLPEIRLACFPPVGIAVLADRYGPRLAELCLTGKTLSAIDAHAARLLHHLVPAGHAEETALSLADAMAAHSPSVLGLTARTLRRLSQPHYEHSLEKAEACYFDVLASMPDMHEGITAFLQKRPPRFAASAHSPEGASS
jgi:cyclohexa-1,5-dienecarbonyl-CoA hydratase